MPKTGMFRYICKGHSCLFPRRLLLKLPKLKGKCKKAITIQQQNITKQTCSTNNM